ncbi:unnamed protein product [Oikopleura dioica]|uniref:Uncharacterized protein n=1 Tax=Oikopleura dioica TaxID=34765 RepID=E4XJU6_OIKDI|nr:unnamed protein product [Oikopleura dioica]
MKLGKFLSSVLIRALASKRVIVDCDPGIDDALAIKYLLERIHLLFFLIFEIDKEFCFVEHQE